MIIWSMVAWWYTDGWYQCLLRVKNRMESVIDYFSIGLLARTIFAPFRQISAGAVRGSLDVQARAFLDRLISRCIGAVVRLIMIGIGGLVILGNTMLGAMLLVGWGLLPLLPLVGGVLFILEWVPWKN